jgi:prolyl oligopeptidase
MSRYSPLSIVVIAAAAVAIGVACATAGESSTVAVQEQPVEKPVEKQSPYPESKRGDVVDDYHGTKVPDPYRWLEDPDAPDTVAWVQAQNKVTFDWLARVATRDAMKERLTALWNYERYSAPFVEGKGKNRRTYFWKNDGLQNQAVLYVVDAGGKEPRMLLDPNALSADGTVAISGMAISDDGALMAYALSAGGSDWMEWRVKDVATGTDKPDVVKWSKFSGASWTPDGKGFFYSRYPEPEKGADLEQANYFHKVYFHTVGEPQEKDQLVFEDPEHKTRGFSAGVTEDGAYLVITVWEGTDRRNRVYFKDLKKKDAAVVKLFDAFDASYDVIGNVGSTFYVVTDKDAPRQRLVKVDVRGLKAPEPKLIEVIAQPATSSTSSTSRGRRSASCRCPPSVPPAALPARARTPRRTTRSRRSPIPRSSTSSTSRRAHRRSGSSRRWHSMPTTSRRSRSSIRRSMARGSRCSSCTRRASLSTATTPPISTPTVASTSH